MWYAHAAGMVHRACETATLKALWEEVKMRKLPPAGALPSNHAKS